MSFHLPYRGLSQELRDVIYKHALCPPEGVTIKADSYSDDSKFICIQPVASALLSTHSQVHGAALPILYGGNVFCLDMSCFDALRFLKTLPAQSRFQIKSVRLPSGLMMADDHDNRDYAKTLSDFLIADMRLEDITLAVPNDMEAGTEGKDEGQYEWFMWTLHEVLLKAFKGGQFRQIRFAHPKIYNKDLSVYGFHNVENHIEDMLIDECRQPLRERRRLYWDRFWDSRFTGTVCEDSLSAVHEYVRDVWHHAGYSVERDSSRQGEKGTALVIRRLSALKKRRQVEAGSAVNGKKARTKEEEKKKDEKEVVKQEGKTQRGLELVGPEKNTEKRESSFLRHALGGVGDSSASLNLEPERERFKIGGTFARDRAVMKCVVKAYEAWGYESERSAGHFGDEPILVRLERSLKFWRNVGCQLCAAYGCYNAADSHQLDKCKRWDESEEAQRILRLLRQVKVKVGRGEDAAGQCYSCLFPRQLCYRFQYRERMDETWGCEREADAEGVFYKDVGCDNIKTARQAVAALMAFENGALVEGLRDRIPWVDEDDAAGMQEWMGEQYKHDSFSIPGIVRGLEMLDGVYEELIKIAEYNKLRKMIVEKEERKGPGSLKLY